jgi:hypothetical protein
MPAATRQSSHQWFAEATTTPTVSARCAGPIQRIRGPVCDQRYQAMMLAQATCTDGMAESWFDSPVP